MSPWDHRIAPEGGFRFSWLWLLLVVVTLIAVIALVVMGLRGHVGVVVAKHSIPPFTKIKASDLETRSVSGEGFGGSETSITELAGGYSTAAVSVGERIETSDVLTLPTGGVGKLRFQIRPDRVEALELEPGERVRIWFSPDADGSKPAAICARLLAVPHSDSTSEQTYVVSMGVAQAHTLVEQLGQSRLLLSRPKEVPR